jgi:carbon-monoxide dehydrogenase medium subunit
VIPVEFDYRRASTVEEAISLLKESAGEGKLLAGGHSLIPLTKLRLTEPGLLVDVAGIESLTGIREVDGQIKIGACTTHRDLETSEVLIRAAPVVARAASKIGDIQVRNRGTIGGSLAHSDPAADLPAVVVAVGAEILISGPGRTRVVPAEAFFQDLLTVDLADDEIITAVTVPPVANGAYAKLRQRASHYAVVGVCAVLDMDGEVCRSARVAATGAATHAQRLTAVEDELAGSAPTAESIQTAAKKAELENLNEDIHASVAYRAAMLKVFTQRAIEAAL